jgi:hypothetical protein
MHPLNHIPKLSLSKKTVLVRDKGQFVHVAMALVEDYKRVIYSSAIKEAYGNPITSLVGEGIPGIEVTSDFFDAKRQADTIVFVDEGEGGMQKDLQAQGIPVFGCAGADVLEQDRWEFKKVLKQRGLQVEPFVTCTGIDDLAKYLKSHDGEELFVKVNNDTRGLLETRRHTSFKLTRSKIDEWAYKLGPCRDLQKFMVCQPIKGEEPGSDHFFTAGDYLSPGVLGFEAKDDGYLGKVTPIDQFPSNMKTILDGMRPVFRKQGVQGALSTEMRGGKVLTFTDFCARFGCPPSGISVAGVSNFGEVVENVAHGQAVIPRFKGKYLAEIIVRSPISENETLALQIKDKDLEVLRVPYLCKIDGLWRRVSIPNAGTNIAEACGWGDTIEDAQAMAFESAEKMKADEVDFNDDVFTGIEDSIKTFCKTSGFKF